MKNKDIGDTIKSMAVLLEEISHELVNKIATLQMKQQGMEQIVPVLMKGYHLAVQNNLIPETVSRRMLDGVGDLTNLNEQLTPMLEILDRINQHMDSILKPQKEPEYSIRQCVQSMLAQASFNPSDSFNKIQVMLDDDFFITYPNLFVEAACHHILHDLLDVLRAKSVKIRVSAEHNSLSIIGYQAVPQKRTSIFDHYIHEPYDKSYPGLGLCRLAFQVFGGDIKIKEAVEELVEYQLVF